MKCVISIDLNKVSHVTGVDQQSRMPHIYEGCWGVSLQEG